MFRRHWCLLVVATMLAVGTAPAAVLAQSGSPAASTGVGAGASIALTMPTEPGPVAQGHYLADVSPESSISFDVLEDGWTGAGGPGHSIVMGRMVGEDRGELGVTSFAGTVPTDPCSRDENVTDVPGNAAAFADWLVAQPWAVAAASPTTFDGLPAVQIDISSLKPVCEGGPMMFVWHYADGAPFRLAPSEAVRVMAVDRDDEVILITAETVQAASLPAFLASAMPVIESIRFGDAAAPTGSPAPDAGGSSAP